MKDRTKTQIEGYELPAALLDEDGGTSFIRQCLEALYRDTEHSLCDEVVPGLTFEQLIGALRLARFYASDSKTLAKITRLAQRR